MNRQPRGRLPSGAGNPGNAMDRIGFIYNFREGTTPQRPYLTHRAVPMADVLRASGVQLFMFSPRHLHPETGRVVGHIVTPDGYESQECNVPLVNGNWYLGRNLAVARHGLGLARFRAWARDRGLDVYPHHGFTRLVKDKLKTYRLVRKLDPTLHPHTEPLRDSARQIQGFLDRCRTVFIKPRRGNRGRKILVLRHDEQGLTLSYYDEQERHTDAFGHLEPVLERIRGLTSAEDHVIQEGVNVARDDDASFIARVIMVHDGARWHWIHKAVVAARGGDVANTSQGGSNDTLAELFDRLYDAGPARSILDDLRRAAFSVTEWLDEQYRGRLMELGYDFLVDREHRVHLLEINTQPGMAKPGLTGDQPFADIFHPAPAEQEIYDRLVVPHATFLARFLLSRLAARRNTAETRPA